MLMDKRRAYSNISNSDHSEGFASIPEHFLGSRRRGPSSPREQARGKHIG
ncbi:hypothetical protein B4109_0308 [Geobacillus stearothermophilus]|uniref:Uncharacterized protein n=1 Tax=Geobacillus stearothermophilus TaxID=1422 RepID=A0A150MHS6_GEOSE|nr:hypothetical protein B4109_0308 [Geobacillus stearothermophilus]